MKAGFNYAWSHDRYGAQIGPNPWVSIDEWTVQGNLAAAGEVLVSSTTKELVAGSGLRFAERGTRRLKGISDEWRLFAATA